MVSLRWPIGAKHNAVPVKKHNNLFQNTTIFCRTQQSFAEHNNLLQNTTIFSRTKYNLTERNNLLQNRTIFPRTQQSFREQNTIWQNTTIFSRTWHNLIEHKRKLIQNKINWNTKAFHKTQQNFKVLVTSPGAESDRNVELVSRLWFGRLAAMFRNSCGSWKSVSLSVGLVHLHLHFQQVKSLLSRTFYPKSQI